MMLTGKLSRSLVICLLLMVKMGLSEETVRFSIPANTTPVYSIFVIDEVNSKVIVASTNSIFRLNLNLSLDNQVQAPPTEDAVQLCNFNFRSNADCQNYHQVLVLPNGLWQYTDAFRAVRNVADTILVCGSNAFVPMCYYRNKITLEVSQTYESQWAPYGQINNWIPSLWITSVGTLWLGTTVDDRLNTYRITVSDAPFAGQLQAGTLDQARTWFFKATPVFVGAHEIGEHMFFFFRERAAETDQQVIYSRVARVCKNDLGVERDGERIFTTFIKARMSCSTRARSINDPVYHFNDIHGTFHHTTQNRIYAVFQAPQNGPVGSVMCTYTFDQHPDDLARVFSNKYLEEVAQDRFETRDNFDPFTCDANSRSLDEALRIQFVSSIATQIGDEPDITMYGYAFQWIVVDTFNDQDILFIATTKRGESELLVLKIFIPNIEGLDDLPHHVIDTIVLPARPDSSHIVTTMQLLGSGPQAHLYVGTETDIYRVPVQRCDLHDTCCKCVTARDPYCGYDSTTELCAPVSAGTVDLTQDLVAGDMQLCATGVWTTPVDDGGGHIPTTTCVGAECDL